MKTRSSESSLPLNIFSFSIRSADVIPEHQHTFAPPPRREEASIGVACVGSTVIIEYSATQTTMVLITPAPIEGADPSSPKKSKLTTQQDAARRLVEYCVVVSSVRKKKPDDVAVDTSQDWGEDDVVYDDYDFQPVITARYPLEDHADNPLHESTTFFCHPSGISLRAEPSMPKVRPRTFHRIVQCAAPWRATFWCRSVNEDSLCSILINMNASGTARDTLQVALYSNCAFNGHPLPDSLL